MKLLFVPKKHKASKPDNTFSREKAYRGAKLGYNGANGFFNLQITRISQKKLYHLMATQPPFIQVINVTSNLLGTITD